MIVGDVGGTHIRFALTGFAPARYAQDTVQGSQKPSLDNVVKWAGADFSSLEEALEKYIQFCSLSGKTDELAMCLAIAGPVFAGRVQLTNRDWQVDAQALQAHFKCQRVRLFNDFAAMTRCVPALDADDLISMRAGKAIKGAPVLVAGAGTGFGVGYLMRVAGGWHALTTEGGHMAYAPHTQREREVLVLLQKQYGYVSVENVCSGMGLEDVHRAVCVLHGQAFESLAPQIMHERAKQGDEICLEVCQIRAQGIMSALGDLALMGGTRGGVVLAGGVSERLYEFLLQDDMIKRFLSRGVRTDYVADMPIDLLKNQYAPLIGAAHLYYDADGQD